MPSKVQAYSIMDFFFYILYYLALLASTTYTAQLAYKIEKGVSL
jgi:hypothetical protein